MSTPEIQTKTQYTLINTVQMLQIESGGLNTAYVATAVGDSLRTSCINDQKSPPSRYNDKTGKFEHAVGDPNAQCGYTIIADEETFALTFLCSKSGELCGRRDTLKRSTEELINRVAVYCVPQEAAIS